MDAVMLLGGSETIFFVILFVTYVISLIIFK
jgi:hypothetical protein